MNCSSESCLLFGVCLLALVLRSHSSVFKRNPDLQRKSIGDDIELIWELSKNKYSVHQSFRFQFKDAILFQYEIGSRTMTMQDRKYKSRLSIRQGGDNDRIGFELRNITTADAGRYKCIYAINDPPKSEATLFIYDEPLKPTISTHEVTRGNPPTKTGKGFKCFSKSTSQPETSRPNMEYTIWDGADDSKLGLPATTLGVYHMEDLLVRAQGKDSVSFYCKAKEEGSDITAVVGESFNLTRPSLTAAGYKIKKVKKNDHPRLQWTYMPGPLGDSPVDFEITFTSADTIQAQTIYLHSNGEGQNAEEHITPIQGNSTHFGFVVGGVTLENAGTYRATATRVGDLLLTDSIVLSVQEKPTKPLIVRAESDEDVTMEILTCESSARSLPEETRSEMEYTWLEGNTIINSSHSAYSLEGNTLKIKNISLLFSSQKPIIAYTCYSNEKGATEKLFSENSETIFIKREMPPSSTKPPPGGQGGGRREPVPDGDSERGMGVIVYIVIALVVGALIVILVVFLIIKRRKSLQREEHRYSIASLGTPLTGHLSTSQYPTLARENCRPYTRTYVNPAAHLQQGPNPLCAYGTSPPITELDLGQYLHSPEKSHDDIVWSKPISVGPCFIVQKGAVLGLSQSELVLKKVNDEAIGDLNILDHMKTLLDSQIVALKQTNHENVVKFLGCCTLLDPHFCMTELASTGSLRDMLVRGRSPSTPGGPDDRLYSPMSYLEQLMYARDVAAGMKYLHSLSIGILHPHLASCHMLVFNTDRNPACKVSGFVLSRDIESKHLINKKMDDIRSLRWLAPETLLGMKHTTKSDVWSFGILLWEIVNQGRTPFPNTQDHEIIDYVKSGQRMDKPSGCKEDLYDGMSQCWMRTPENRPDFSQLLHHMENLVDKEQNTYASISQVLTEMGEADEINGNGLTTDPLLSATVPKTVTD